MLAFPSLGSTSRERSLGSHRAVNEFLLPPATSFVQRIGQFEPLSALKYELKPGSYHLREYYSSGGLFYPPAYRTLGLSEEEVKSLPFKAWHGKLAANELSFTILSGAAQH
jgi:hypothetical protein